MWNLRNKLCLSRIYPHWRLLAITVLLVSILSSNVLATEQSELSEPWASMTICEHRFTDLESGWRSKTWEPSDCSNGLPRSDATAIGQGLNGNGNQLQVTCTPTAGYHYNVPWTTGETTGTVKCLYFLPDTVSTDEAELTQCVYSWPEYATGWRSHYWTESDCTNGVPKPGAVSIGQGKNQAGHSGQVNCYPHVGQHYNHPTRHGATTGSVKCLFLNPKTIDLEDPPMTQCRYSWTSNATGWREHAWQEEDCSNGVPEPGHIGIGQARNGNGTVGMANCDIEKGHHYNHPEISGATTGSVNCMFVKPATMFVSTPPGDTTSYAYDLDQDGQADTNLALKDDADGNYVLEVKSKLMVDTEIALPPLSAGAVQPKIIVLGPRIKLIGDHTGDGLQEIAVLHTRNGSHFSPALSVLSSIGPTIRAHTTAPLSLEEFHQYDLASFTDFPASPDGKLFPFLAPSYGDTSQANEWGYMCLFRPNIVKSSQDRCGEGFMEASTDPTDISGTQQHYPYAYFREVGGYLQDLDDDGWEDINLIYHACVLSISGKTGEQLTSTVYDVALSEEPKWFHLGRNYGTHSAIEVDGGLLRNVMVGGATVGAFSDTFCNVSRFVGVLENPAGDPSSRELKWSRYYGFHSSTFPMPYDIDYADDPSQCTKSPPVTRLGDMVDGCIHRFSDSRSMMDGQEIVVFNYFVAPPTEEEACTCEQYQLNLPPVWTDEKQRAWYECMKKNLAKIGQWGMQVLREADGASLTGSLDTYIWGRTDKVLPSGEIVYLVEILPSQVRFDMTDVPPSQLLVYSLVNGFWQNRGRLPISGRPKVAIQSPGGSRGVGSFTYFAELTLKDVNGDGLSDIQMNDGPWVGYSHVAEDFVVIQN